MSAKPSTSPTPSPRSSPLPIVITIVACAAVVYGAFYLLSGMYFDGKRDKVLGTPIGAEAVRGVLRAFALFTIGTTAAAVAAVFQPRWVGHAIAGAAGLAALVASYFAFHKDMPNELSVALVVAGLALVALVALSLLRSRPAWSFLVAMTGTLALVTFLAAPKLRGQLDISLWSALLLPGLLTVACIALVVRRADYRQARA